MTEVSKSLLTCGEYVQILDKHDLMCVVMSSLLGGINIEMEKVLLESLGAKIPNHFREQYFQHIEPEIKKSLKTGELSLILQQLLPIKIESKDLIKIKRSN